MELTVDIPMPLVMPDQAFLGDYWRLAEDGRRRLENSKVAFVGLARNCAQPLAHNLRRIVEAGAKCRQWCLHIEENDSEDETVQVMHSFCEQFRQGTYTSQRLQRKQYGAEFAGPRTIALAEYRDACQRWVEDTAADSDYVCVVDFDAWGGWIQTGFLNAVGWLTELPGAYGMAAVSLFQYGEPPRWCHYDLWALRGLGQADCYFDAYQNGYGAFGFTWLPPVGSPPVLVSSAFGGFALYRTEAYLQGTYDGTADCEHVAFHRSIANATGQHLYVCPGLRTVMSWHVGESNGGQHSHD